MAPSQPAKKIDDLSLEKNEQAQEKPDVAAIMSAIRSKIKEVVGLRDETRPFKPMLADFDKSPRKAGELVHSEELRYLNSNHAYGLRLNLDGISSHRPGFIGSAIVKLKRKVLGIIWNSLLKDYLQAEKDFQANLVRILNDTTKYIDSRDAANFWELIRKIDYDNGKALERIERINDEQTAAQIALERRIYQELKSTPRELEQVKSEIQVLNSVVSGLEGIISKLGKERSSLAAEPHSNPVDYSYLLLENRFRGSEAEIASRLSIYPPIFVGTKQPVLEIGSGRGELQELFKQAKVPSYGVDLDAAMVEHTTAKGLDTRLENGIVHLQNLPDRSLGGVIAVQVVEHLKREALEELFSLCAKKIVSGGRVVFETINPRSLLALSSNYFRDPTHVWPLHPDTLGYSMTQAGLKVIETRELSPVAEQAQLRAVEVDAGLAPRMCEVLNTLNFNIKQLNRLIYGSQDYCVIAEVR